MEESLFCQMEQRCREGQFALAANQARRLLHDRPDDGALWQLYGTASFSLGDCDTALSALEHASALIPLHQQGQLALASCYCLKGKRDVAALMFKFLAEKAHDTQLLSWIATRLGGLARYESALQVCHKIKQIDPNHHQAYFGVAFYLNLLGSPPQALIFSLERALELAPDVLQYRINLASVLYESGRQQQARELLEPIALETVSCACLVKRMQEIFERLGDGPRTLLCRVRLACLLQ